ncbi:hypothetical protein LZZ85_27500 [Terrimonas sp. NA20]|uniref:Uncharacterized protein n=1 Tax=Terrimonas ginsenosidimutans TaxID=2908004 RepID=A0ABS9L0H6_9BACT|nr:hypothetical protein [Terrimonas ginsenosidimutans]MCG2618079.1 hypothetical protein [Terrimonas ginsenosidimutans]
MNNEILITKQEGNFFFGFHDIPAWNSKGNKLAALRIDNIYTPPQSSSICDVGFVEDGEFIKLGTTNAFNYPQGARQQWIGNTELLIVNDRIDNAWRSKVYDTESRREVSELAFSTHVITDEGWAFGLDYSRLHRVGGYGYTGLKDETAGSDTPDNAGIIRHNVYSKESNLIVSIKQVSEFQSAPGIGQHHYITHLVLNPSQTRIAFLHRSKLKDGGETSRLMTIGVDGRELRCLATGFLSHFDWKDDNHVAIWGRTGSGIEKLRNSVLYRMMPSGLISRAKKIIKKLIYKPKPAMQGASLFNWLVFSDETVPKQTFLAKGVITEDGHPMFCPANRDWMICDNYPDKDGVRTLFLFQDSTQRKIDLGKYKMIPDKPDMSSIGDALVGVEASVLKAFDIRNMAFYRSGLHCDLHPRWKKDGTMVAFDSIHEGKRSIYGYEVGEILFPIERK